MSKWEYCSLVGIGKSLRELDPKYPAVWYFTKDGIRAIEIKGGKDSEREKIANAIASLGELGWEMVGCSSGSFDQGTNHGDTLYFKRQIS